MAPLTMRGALLAAIGIQAIGLTTMLGAQTDALFGPPRKTPQHLTVATSASASTVRPGAVVSLYVDVVPDPGIHVYAPGAKGYTPVALTLAPRKDATFGRTMYPKSELLLSLNETVAVYAKAFRLTRELTVAKTAAPGSSVQLAGTVDYQACDDKVCFVPASAPVNWTLAVK